MEPLFIEWRTDMHEEVAGVWHFLEAVQQERSDLLIGIGSSLSPHLPSVAATTNKMQDNSIHNDEANVSQSTYSFYLNVVVLNHVAPQPSDGEDEGVVTDDATENIIPFSTSEEENSPTTTPSKNESKRPLLESTQLSIRDLGKAMSKKSAAVSSKASAYVAGRTMVSRASSALTKSLPDVVASTGLDLTLERRFDHGSVFVVRVDLKAAGLPQYIEEVRDADAAENFCSAVSALTSLGATESVRSLEKEMLPQVRRGLMEKLSNLLLKTMKEKEAMLEVDCIALEEAEEARWLFTFMEFQAQMK